MSGLLSSVMGNRSDKFWFKVGCLSGLSVVCIGAFGGHGLRSNPDKEERYINAYHTGVNYQMFHTLPFFIVSYLLKTPTMDVKRVSRINRSGYLFLMGILLFSGSLYTLGVTEVKKVGMITPIGGFSFIFAWMSLFTVV